jgi:hypothetical protein
MPITAVPVWICFRSPLANTDRIAPVTARRPSASNETFELRRTRMASRPTTNTISPSAPVVIVSPARASPPSLAGVPFTRTSPRTR